MKRYHTAVLACTMLGLLSIVILWPRHDPDAETVAWKDGWNACFIDSDAIIHYHDRANALTNDEDPIALSNIWRQCIIESQQSEATWNKLTFEQKRDYDISPFWKRGVGEPRRISHGQRMKFIEALGNANSKSTNH